MEKARRLLKSGPIKEKVPVKSCAVVMSLSALYFVPRLWFKTQMLPVAAAITDALSERMITALLFYRRFMV
jgi:hypothetical protein